MICKTWNFTYLDVLFIIPLRTKRHTFPILAILVRVQNCLKMSKSRNRKVKLGAIRNLGQARSRARQRGASKRPTHASRSHVFDFLWHVPGGESYPGQVWSQIKQRQTSTWPAHASKRQVGDFFWHAQGGRSLSVEVGTKLSKCKSLGSQHMRKKVMFVTFSGMCQIRRATRVKFEW